MIWQALDLRWVYAHLLPGIVRQTRSRHVAEDVLHDAFVRYALAQERDLSSPRVGSETGAALDGASALRQPHAYLRRVVETVLADHYRMERRYAHWQDDDARLATLEAQGQVPSAEALADIRQRLGRLQAVIDGLPPRCRESFWLFRVEGLPQAEVAQRLGVSVNMVERHIMRAMLELRAAREGLEHGMAWSQA